MYYFNFSIFFVLNFALWVILPALVLRNMVKPEKRKKDDNFDNKLIAYGGLSIIYILIYVVFYRYFSSSINEMKLLNEGSKYFVNNIMNLSLIIILFLIISTLLNIFTFYLSKKAFKLSKVNIGYVLIMINGLFNVITYWLSNYNLKLELYSFENNHHFLNLILKIDYEMLLFLFPLLVFTNFVVILWKAK